MKNKLSLTAALLMSTMLLAAPAIAREGDDNAQDNALTNAAEGSSAPDKSPFKEATPPSTNEHVLNSAAGAKASVPVISGGVGDEDMARIKGLQKDYNLKLLITENNGTFISDVAVRIKDLKGNTLAEATAEGPILLADLPAGKYKVEVSHHDEVKEKQVSVAKGKLSAYQITFKDTDPKFSGDPKTTSLN